MQDSLDRIYSQAFGEAEPPMLPDMPDGVSFVMPVFNKVEFLPGVLDALWCQARGRARQFIFIDDGSSDGSFELVLERTADWPDCVVRQQPNAGPASATNAGLAFAKYRYLKLVGSDDVLAPFATDLLIERLEQLGVGAIFSKLGYYRDPSEIRFDEAAFRAAATRVIALPEVIEKTISGTTQTLYRTPLVHAAGGCNPRLFVEDYSLALGVARWAPVALLDAISCYGPAEHPSRLMVGLKHQTMHDYNAALRWFLAEHPDLPRALQRSAIRRTTGRAWKWARREGGVGPFTPHQFRWLAGYLPFGPDPVEIIERTLTAFELGRHAQLRPLIRDKVKITAPPARPQSA